MEVITMPDLQGIRREALKDIVKDLKVMKQVCYPYEETGIDCKNCESYALCDNIFGGATPKMILEVLDKQKEGTH